VNDVFGFFISGPGISGQQNIALIPGTGVPVSINTLNNGTVGTAVFTPDPNCILSNSGYFVDNDNPPGLTVQYDGFTTVLTAIAKVMPCQTYHLKFAIADGGDDAYDSGVFLETESFMSNNSVHSVAAIPSGSLGCAPFTTTFQNHSVGSNRFRWIFGDGSPVDSSANPTHTFTNPGTYAVQLIALDTGQCGSPDTSYINVYADSGLVSASFNSVLLGQCDSLRVDNSTSSRGAQRYFWNYGDGATGTGAFHAHTYLNSGNYTITHVAMDTVCQTTDTATRNVSLLPRVRAAIQASSDAGCNPMDLSMCYPDTVHAGMHLYWDFANGTSSSLNCDSVHYTSSGVYRTQLIVTDSLSCNFADTSYFDVSVRITPEAEFSLSGAVNIIFPVQFENNSVNGILYQWSFGDGDSSSLYEPMHTYSDTGIYRVCLMATRDECLDTTCHDLNIFSVPQTIWFPASFTPNGDGRNDFFTVEGLGIASMKVRILNRWGELVFDGSAEKPSWDGNWKGSPAVSGVYAITVETIFLDGEVSKKYGSITLYR
jgi:gliding motility-associated-like protein